MRKLGMFTACGAAFGVAYILTAWVLIAMALWGHRRIFHI